MSVDLVANVADNTQDIKRYTHDTRHDSGNPGATVLRSSSEARITNRGSLGRYTTPIAVARSDRGVFRLWLRMLRGGAWASG